MLTHLPRGYGFVLLLFAAIMLFFMPRVVAWYVDFEQRRMESWGFETNASYLIVFSILWLGGLILILVSLAMHTLHWPWFFNSRA